MIAPQYTNSTIGVNVRFWPKADMSNAFSDVCFWGVKRTSAKACHTLISSLQKRAPWRAATQGNGKCPQGLKRDAAAAWRRFVSCVSALPPDQAGPMWQAAFAEAQPVITRRAKSSNCTT
jgi:hypothetical protein